MYFWKAFQVCLAILLNVLLYQFINGLFIGWFISDLAR